MGDKFPLIVSPEKDSKGEFKVATSFQTLLDASRSVRKDLEYVEQDYALLISNLRCLLIRSGTSGRRDPRIYWLAGDEILSFLRRMDDLGFFLHQQNKTLARDVGVHESLLKRVISFRRRFPLLSQVDPSILWTRYRSNAVPLPGSEKDQGV
ncbi:MAG: hypothetical protein HY676_04785 [Chloroflexi bacterium]|nr:hypothetical protein [Chloroflexota bacterium]